MGSSGGSTTITIEGSLPRPKPGPLTALGRYAIVEWVGAGGMGEVYRARDPVLGREVAIKLVRNRSGGSEEETRLVREAQLLARVDHPRVVPVYDVGVAAGQVFVVMPYLAGGTLRGWLATPRSPAAILNQFDAACEGLIAAHAAGLVHRDFKPDNVLLGLDGEVRVADFGLARGRSDEPSPAPSDAHVAAEIASRSAIAGTPPYMAPEQLAGEPVDARCDQFAFAVALWQALYGRHPFDVVPRSGAPLAVLLDRIARGPTAAPRDPRTAAIEPVLRRALAVRAADRWPTLRELRDALRTARSAVPARRRWRALRPPLVLGALALAVTAVGVDPRSPVDDPVLASPAPPPRAVTTDRPRPAPAPPAPAPRRTAPSLARSRDASSPLAGASISYEPAIAPVVAPPVDVAALAAQLPASPVELTAHDIPSPPPRPASLARYPRPKHDYRRFGLSWRRRFPGAKVVLDLAIDARGRVTDARVIQSLDPHTDAASMAAARRFEFEPALDETGRPIAGQHRWEFVIGDELSDAPDDAKP